MWYNVQITNTILIGYKFKRANVLNLRDGGSLILTFGILVSIFILERLSCWLAIAYQMVPWSIRSNYKSGMRSWKLSTICLYILSLTIHSFLSPLLELFLEHQLNKQNCLTKLKSIKFHYHHTSLKAHVMHKSITTSTFPKMWVVEIINLGVGLFIPCTNLCKCRNGYNLRH